MARGLIPPPCVPRPGRGNGLKNMRQRLEKIGGRCEIQSQPGAGTEIIFQLTVPATSTGSSLKFKNRVIN